MSVETQHTLATATCEEPLCLDSCLHSDAFGVRYPIKVGDQMFRQASRGPRARPAPKSKDLGSSMSLAFLGILFASQHPKSRNPGVPQDNKTPTPRLGGARLSAERRSVSRSCITHVRRVERRTRSSEGLQI